MRNPLILLTRFCLVSLLVVCEVGSISSVSAQQRRRQRHRPRRVTKTEAVKTEESPPPPSEETLIRKNMGEACKELRRTMVDANAYYSQFPYDEIAPAESFIANCTNDGTVSWTATRKFDPADAAPLTYQLTFALKVSELNLGRLDSEHGVVAFVSEEDKDAGRNRIHLNGYLHGAAVADMVADARLDLRHEPYAQKFTSKVRDIVKNLALLKDLKPTS